MNIWRLIAHHENASESIELMKDLGCIAIGWSDIGDLKQIAPNNQSEITNLIDSSYPNLDNAHLGGPSLWNLYQNVKEGDFVIVNTNGRRNCVFEVTGPYVFNTENPILGYMHQRQAVLTDISAEKLWKDCSSTVQAGQNIRWTLAGCQFSEIAEGTILKEGARFSVISTAIERNPAARKKCIEHYGYTCAACDINMESKYGRIGKNFIHVHHRIDLASIQGIHRVDPLRDLIPLCPNCHAMIHKEKPAMPLEKLRAILREHA
ncbi:HNH endonuclease [Vibrio sinaloensis DSM 21326]|uniref:HNH endonuclease n=1 Tax=Vibrio sinaloensis DSM 21326 TaxID=945550 RepID=E8M153_PHOS4|nr:HNH endonuclease [Vibrio sinaloensis]EGA72292.1 HNH endonuclease [Vibrio sinaloensis DSM 21326]